ncbi:MAG: pilus assembly protein [Actinobacteria bacterium]|nr:pilus assembly protein [Actinomycetota bacterium]
MRLVRALSGREKGQAMVEFALILPVLLLIIMGIMEFGRAYSAYLTIQNASREGARLGVTGTTDTEITAAVNQVASTLDTAGLTVSITPAEASRSRGELLTVTVSYRFQFLVPLISEIVGPLGNFASSTTMRLE